MKIRKAAALLMTMTMIASVMTGCGRDQNSSDRENTGGSLQEQGDLGKEQEADNKEVSSGGTVQFPLEETMEFTSFSGTNMEYVLDDTLAMQVAMEEANIHISFDSVLPADLAEKRGLILASGEYPDMFFKSNLLMGDLNKYGAQGIFIPLEDLIRQYAPNLTAVLDARELWQYITSPDGHIYSLPSIFRAEGSMLTYWINQKWLDNLGLQEPASFEELYEVLKAFKEQDANGNGDPNDEIPWTTTLICTPDQILAYEDYNYDSGTRMAVIDGELVYLPTSEKFKDYVNFVTRCYQEGLLDKNAFTQAHEQQGAIGQSRDVLGSFFDAGAFLTVGRDRDEEYIALTPFQKGTYPLSTGIIEGTMVITDKCEHPEVLVAWADRFYSEEGGVLAWLGVEDKTYRINEAGDWEWIVGEGYGDDILSVRCSSTLVGSENNPCVQPDFWYTNMSRVGDPDEVYLNEQRAKVAEGGKVPLPMMNYSENDNKRIATFRSSIDSYINEYVAKVATGELNLEDSWEEYLETMKSMGAEDMVEIYRNVYEASK